MLKHIRIGDRIRIISCPRLDEADAYAGWEGVVTHIDYKKKFTNIVLKWGWLPVRARGVVEIERDRGGVLIICGLQPLKYEKMRRTDH